MDGNEEVEQVFQSLKEWLGILPQKTSPNTVGLLLPYLAIFNHAVSMVLLVKRNGERIPKDYVSYISIRIEQQYPFIEKFAYALLI